ncbi:putative sulfate exporter family transporter [Lysobacteraceae bacterium NML08-0793]|nr:putative sulfate exporter family transporter [Xanthomonadaceae bacterium NML08-0793]
MKDSAATAATGFFHSFRAIWPGLAVATIAALAATFVAENYGGPKFLYALLIGVSLHFLSEHGRCQAGVEFAAKKLVRIGVALLGARIALADVNALGALGVAALAGAVVLTILFGLLLARLLRLPPLLGLISGGATGICGISAAMAISSTLPQTEENERYTLMTAIGVAVLSTTVMVLYPLLVQWAGWSVPMAGLFLGGSIHDVAQVVGAGNIISPEVAQAATLAKMLRVAMLVPVVLVLALLFRDQVAAFARAGGKVAHRPPLLPLFLLVFVALVVVNSLGWIPAQAQAAAGSASQWALVISIAALGVKTSFEKILALGWRPLALMVGETLFVALFMLLAVSLLAG